MKYRDIRHISLDDAIAEIAAEQDWAFFVRERVRMVHITKQWVSHAKHDPDSG